MSEIEFTIDKANLEVRSSRVYAATPERLWQACTNPEQVPKWWGPAEMKTVVEKLEVSVGGRWRIIQTDSDGKEYAFRGEFKEVDEPRKMVRTFEYEPIAGHVLVETMDIEPVSATETKLTTTAHYDNIEDLEGMVSMGMEKGQVESFERMAELVKQA